MDKFNLVVAFCVICLHSFALASIPERMTHESRLIADLLSSYNPIVKPSINENGNLNVSISMSFNRLNNWEDGVLSLRTWMTLRWSDPRLTWLLGDYAGIKDIRIPSNRLWTPDMYLYNNEGKADLTDSSALVVVYNDGTLLWVPTVQMQSTCNNGHEDEDDDEADDNNLEKNVGWRYQCKVKIGSWMYDSDKLNLTADTSADPLQNYQDANRDWKIIRVDVKRNESSYDCCTEKYVDILYKLRIKRKA